MQPHKTKTLCSAARLLLAISRCGYHMNKYLSADGTEWYCESCAPDDAGHWPCGDERDCPEHCAGCGRYLDHPLTSHGVEYVLEQAEEEARRPLAERQRIMPAKGTGEDTESFRYWFGSPHCAIVDEWLADLQWYGLPAKQRQKIEALRRLFARDMAKAA